MVNQLHFLCIADVKRAEKENIYFQTLHWIKILIKIWIPSTYAI